MRKIDFMTSQRHFLDHLLPIAKAIGPYLGNFYVTSDIFDYAALIKAVPNVVSIPRNNNISYLVPAGDDAVVFAASGDAQKWYNGERGKHRTKIMMEHGVGITFKEASYAGGRGIRDKIDFFLCPNEYIKEKISVTQSKSIQAVIGTPKLDDWKDAFEKYETNIYRKFKVVISFHWDCEVAPEAGNAFWHYRKMLGHLAKSNHFTIAGHGHPRIIDKLEKFYDECGIPTLQSFDHVMTLADIYVNDSSSTAYEFCVTGKPVVLMNAPWFRKNVHHGIRFWDYTNIGPQVDDPFELEDKIVEGFQKQFEYRAARREMIKDLYPYLGGSAEQAAGILIHYFGSLSGDTLP